MPVFTVTSIWFGAGNAGRAGSPDIGGSVTNCVWVPVIVACGAVMLPAVMTLPVITARSSADTDGLLTIEPDFAS